MLAIFYFLSMFCLQGIFIFFYSPIIFLDSREFSSSLTKQRKIFIHVLLQNLPERLLLNKTFINYITICAQKTAFILYYIRISFVMVWWPFHTVVKMGLIDGLACERSFFVPYILGCDNCGKTFKESFCLYISSYTL